MALLQFCLSWRHFWMRNQSQNEFPQAYSSRHLLICWYSWLNVKCIGPEKRVYLWNIICSDLGVKITFTLCLLIYFTNEIWCRLHNFNRNQWGHTKNFNTTLNITFGVQKHAELPKEKGTWSSNNFDKRALCRSERLLRQTNVKYLATRG